MSRRFIVFDTETTGLARRKRQELHLPQSVSNIGSEVCQIGGLVLDDQMNPKKFFCHYCDTVVAESSREAFNVHGLQQRKLREYVAGQFLGEIMVRYLPEFFEQDTMFLGYNTEFDMLMVAQTIANSSVKFTWTPFKGNILPKRGRYSIDIAEYVKHTNHYRKLISFESELKPKREAFLGQYMRNMSVQTNCVELLQESWKSHNALFDAVSTYILWGEYVWKKRLV